jgi:hypothetical protein
MPQNLSEFTVQELSEIKAGLRVRLSMLQGLVSRYGENTDIAQLQVCKDALHKLEQVK